jgi:hypothetical protein
MQSFMSGLTAYDSVRAKCNAQAEGEKGGWGNDANWVNPIGILSYALDVSVSIAQVVQKASLR